MFFILERFFFSFFQPDPFLIQLFTNSFFSVSSSFTSFSIFFPNSLKNDDWFIF